MDINKDKNKKVEIVVVDGEDSMTKWKYYNHAMVPTTTPHEDVDTTDIENGSVWCNRGEQTPLLARWISDFDCGYETEWWYTIKDTPFDITKLKAKKRYYVNQGRKNFEFRQINPNDYLEMMADVQEAAWNTYPSQYRPEFDRESSIEEFKNIKGIVFGVFLIRKEDLEERLCGYNIIHLSGRVINYSIHKVIPKYEKLGVNYALVDGTMSYFQSKLSNGFYFSNGQRSTNHETNFNEFLEKYFGWRKAYCKLHLVYNPKIAWIIQILYPFRVILRKIDKIAIIHKINAVLLMEEFSKKCK